MEHTAKPVMSLDGCSGCFESSLDAHVIALVLSRSGSFELFLSLTEKDKIGKNSYEVLKVFRVQ